MVNEFNRVKILGKKDSVTREMVSGDGFFAVKYRTVCRVLMTSDVQTT